MSDTKLATTKTESIHEVPFTKMESGEVLNNTKLDQDLIELPESLRGMSDEELEHLAKRTTRKIDLRILPMLVFIYVLNFLDRNNIATARLGGLEKDLKLKGTQYQTAISILFVGYITMQVPFNLIMNKLGRPSLFITTIMTVWGVISTCTGAVHSFGALVAIRILLGIAEAGFFPACLYYLSCWYTKKELGKRNSIFYSAIFISGAFAGLIGAGIIDNMDGVHGLRSWRWLFIIEGAVTVGTVPFAYFILADNPNNTKWLSQQEKDIVMWRLSCEVGQADSDNVEGNTSFKNGLKLAVLDVKVWMITGLAAFITAAAGVGNFFPSVVQTLKYNRINTLLLTAPPYLIAIVAVYTLSWHADKSGGRFWHIVGALLVGLVAFIIAVSTLNTGARYFAMCLMPSALYGAFAITMTWVSNIVPRPPVKRAVALAMMNCLANSTGIWNSYLYPITSAPRYTEAFSANAAFIFCAIIMAFILKTYLGRLNQKIENGTMDWEKEFGKGNDGSHVRHDFRFSI